MLILTKQHISGLLLLSLLILTGTATYVIGKQPILVPLSTTVFHDNISNKDWQVDRSRRIKDANEVRKYLEKLNHNGKTDWRLPTEEELYTLFSRFDFKDNGQVKIRIEGKYWLKDKEDKMFIGSWEIGDQCEPTRTFYRGGNAGYVRAIRP